MEWKKSIKIWTGKHWHEATCLKLLSDFEIKFCCIASNIWSITFINLRLIGFMEIETEISQIHTQYIVYICHNYYSGMVYNFNANLIAKRNHNYTENISKWVDSPHAFFQCIAAAIIDQLKSFLGSWANLKNIWLLFKAGRGVL